MKPESMLEDKKVALNPKDVTAVKGGASAGADDDTIYYGGTLDEIIVTPPVKREN